MTSAAIMAGPPRASPAWRASRWSGPAGVAAAVHFAHRESNGADALHVVREADGWTVLLPPDQASRALVGLVPVPVSLRFAQVTARLTQAKATHRAVIVAPAHSRPAREARK